MSNASGDDRDLVELEAWMDYLQECDPDTPGDKKARAALESLFGRIREERDRLAKEMEREERASLQLIDERDAYEEALSQAYYLITGRSPEWSNHFGVREALDAIDNAQEMLREEIRSLRSSSFTPAEIDGVEALAEEIDVNESTQYWRHDAALLKSVVTKLKLISGGALKEGVKG